MSFLGRFSPGIAYRDLRHFVATRERYEFIFLALAIAITGAVMFVFMHDSHVETPYKRNIIYVQNWRLDRSDAEIKAQQVVDEAARKKRLAAEDAQRAKLRAQFKRLDDSLTNMGI